jgi:hypothetical protein
MKKAVQALIDSRILGRALIVGTVLEIALMIASHVRPLLQIHYALFGCMMIAGTAGLLYARDLARGYIMGALGGLVIGAACGIAAVASANVLGDQPERFIPYGVMICALVGAIGGLFGQYAAWIREFIATLRQ